MLYANIARKMSSIPSSASGMMSSAGGKSVARKPSAKKDVVEVAVVAPVVAQPAAKPAAKAAKPAATKEAKPAPVVVSSTPVEAVAPAVAAAPVTTLDEDLKSVTNYLNTVRETVVSLLGHVKRLDKRVHREIKDARRRKRRAKVEDGTEGDKPRTLSIFERPVQVTDELCAFLKLAKGTLISRSQVTKGVNNYVKENNLKDKHAITPDAALQKLLAVPEGDKLTYFNLQRYLNHHYPKTVKPAATA
jgi:chromatin remodeling complex protein RSC6